MCAITSINLMFGFSWIGGTATSRHPVELTVLFSACQKRLHCILKYKTSIVCSNFYLILKVHKKILNEKVIDLILILCYFDRAVFGL